MEVREMRAALSVGLEHMGGFPPSAPDFAVKAIYAARMKAEKDRATRNAQRPAPCVEAITAPKASDEALEMHRRITQADLIQ